MNLFSEFIKILESDMTISEAIEAINILFFCQEPCPLMDEDYGVEIYNATC